MSKPFQTLRNLAEVLKVIGGLGALAIGIVAIAVGFASELQAAWMAVVVCVLGLVAAVLWYVVWFILAEAVDVVIAIADNTSRTAELLRWLAEREARKNKTGGGVAAADSQAAAGGRPVRLQAR